MRYRWAVLAAGTVAQASFSAITVGLAVLAPTLREEYGLSLRQNAATVVGAVSSSKRALNEKDPAVISSTSRT